MHGFAAQPLVVCSCPEKNDSQDLFFISPAILLDLDCFSRREVSGRTAALLQGDASKRHATSLCSSYVSFRYNSSSRIKQ